ncbi:MAG: hypothetical protein KBH81_11315 [Phycisphaerae bacterium]|jgi:hypothetical protein|nr:hypothetical protein [Phycisphaerae bacterium]HOO17207.1 hypothetical protein [Phycisphaerae bacterium]HRS29233.1 hypothetical protein [Phycisphaerae bacterium]
MTPLTYSHQQQFVPSERRQTMTELFLLVAAIITCSVLSVLAYLLVQWFWFSNWR